MLKITSKFLAYARLKLVLFCSIQVQHQQQAIRVLNTSTISSSCSFSYKNTLNSYNYRLLQVQESILYQGSPDAFGVFGFSFLDQNSDALQGALVGGVAPEFEQIASGDYPVSRSLFFYVKKDHVGVIPGIEEFLAAFANDDAWGDEGYLTDKGLIPMGAEERSSVAKTVADLAPLSM